MAVAKDRSALKKRLQRFFNPKIEARARLCEFLDVLASNVDVYIYGGLIRDIARQGVASFGSDIDIVYTGDESALNSVLASFGDGRNSFGGRRLNVGRWQVDIWAAEATWAFAEGYRGFDGIESMLDTTITNWDAILYRWQDKKIICKEDYFKELSASYLDIVLDKNPNMLGMYTRVMRYCVGKFAAKEVSVEVARVLKSAFEEYSEQELLEYEKRSFEYGILQETLGCLAKKVLPAAQGRACRSQIPGFHGRADCAGDRE